MFLIDLLLNLSEEFPMNYNNAPTVISFANLLPENSLILLHH